MSRRWKYCDEHVRNKTKEVTQMIQSLARKKCYFDGFDPEETHWISVDTVNF